MHSLAKEKASVYLFYSMFDLDIVNGMQLDPKKSNLDKLGYQMRRINTALVAPLKARVKSPSAEKGDGERFLVSVGIPYEQKRQARMHTPFVLDVGYRLFGDAAKGRQYGVASLDVLEELDEGCLSFSDIDTVYRMALELEAHSSEWRRIAPQLLRLFQVGGKNELCNFADEFSAVLLGRGMPEEAERVLVSVERLRAPNVRPKQEERSELEELAREWPVYANEAFSRGRDE